MAALVSIAVTPAINAYALPGETVQYTAVGTYDDASTADITTEVFWYSADVSAFTIGLHTGLAIGIQPYGGGVSACEVEGCGGGLVGLSGLQVLSTAYIDVTPKNGAPLRRFTSRQYSAIANYGGSAEGFSVRRTIDPTWETVPLEPAVPVANGGFENGDLTGWTDADSDVPASVDMTNPHSGTYSALLGGTDESYTAMTHPVAVPAEGCALSFWFLPTVEATSPLEELSTTYGQVAAEIVDADENNLAKVMSADYLALRLGRWQQQFVDLRPWGGQTVFLLVWVYSDVAGDGATLRVDDVATHAIAARNVASVTTGGLVRATRHGLCLVEASLP